LPLKKIKTVISKVKITESGRYSYCKRFFTWNTCFDLSYIILSH